MLIIDKSRKTPIALVAGGTVVAIALIAWLASGDPAEPAANVATVAGTPANPSVGGMVPGAARPMASAPLPAEPVEDPAAVFELGHTGGLVVDPTTVASLDRLHAALGENPTPADLAKMEAQLRAGLPKADADKAIKLLNGYRNYSREMLTDVMALGVPQTREAADRVLARMEALQTRNFDPQSAEAMFGAQNKLSRAVMDAALIQMDTGLSNEQKKERLEALRATMPAEQRDAIPQQPAEPASAAAS